MYETNRGSIGFCHTNYQGRDTKAGISQTKYLHSLVEKLEGPAAATAAIHGINFGVAAPIPACLLLSRDGVNIEGRGGTDDTCSVVHSGGSIQGGVARDSIAGLFISPGTNYAAGRNTRGGDAQVRSAIQYLQLSRA